MVAREGESVKLRLAIPVTKRMNGPKRRRKKLLVRRRNG